MLRVAPDVSHAKVPANPANQSIITERGGRLTYVPDTDAALTAGPAAGPLGADITMSRLVSGAEERETREYRRQLVRVELLRLACGIPGTARRRSTWLGRHLGMRVWSTSPGPVGFIKYTPHSSRRSFAHGWRRVGKSLRRCVLRYVKAQKFANYVQNTIAIPRVVSHRW